MLELQTARRLSGMERCLDSLAWPGLAMRSVEHVPTSKDPPAKYKYKIQDTGHITYLYTCTLLNRP